MLAAKAQRRATCTEQGCRRLDDDSRTVQRRRLRMELRRLREDRQLTQRQAADCLEWSMSKLVRIEAGSVSVSRADLNALLDCYKVTSQSERERLHALNPRRESWWQEYQYQISHSFAEYLGFESESLAEANRFNLGVSGSLNTSASSNLRMALTVFGVERDQWLARSEDGSAPLLSLASGLLLRAGHFFANSMISAIDQILVSLQMALVKLALARRPFAVHLLIGVLVIAIAMCHRHSREPADGYSPLMVNYRPLAGAVAA
jgi:transcriptional regulator with XRE-family HTH domain